MKRIQQKIVRNHPSKDVSKRLKIYHNDSRQVMRTGIKYILSIPSTHWDIIQMGLLRLCVTFLTLLLLRKCVYSAVSCPSGDTSGIVKNGLNCSQLMISSPNSECYDATVETSCCASCNAIATGISGCQYGDRVINCIANLCTFYTNPTECCFTCRISSTTTTTTTTTTTMTPSPAGNSTTNSSSQLSSEATTTTITTSPAGNNITSFASQTSSSQSTSAGVIAGSVVGSIAGASLIAGVTYAGVQFFKGTWHDIKNSNCAKRSWPFLSSF